MKAYTTKLCFCVHETVYTYTENLFFISGKRLYTMQKGENQIQDYVFS